MTFGTASLKSFMFRQIPGRLSVCGSHLRRWPFLSIGGVPSRHRPSNHSSTSSTTSQARCLLPRWYQQLGTGLDYQQLQPSYQRVSGSTSSSPYDFSKVLVDISSSSSQLASPKSSMELLNVSGQSMRSVNRPHSGHSPGSATAQSSTPCSDTLIGDILSQASVSMEPEDVDPDVDNTIIKIIKIIKKKDPYPDSRKPHDPQ